MPRLYTYILTDDDGVAPCTYSGMHTLCVCKSVIRRVASVGDLIIGVAGRMLADASGTERGGVVYLARVKRVVSMPEYMHAHAERPDAFYKFRLSTDPATYGLPQYMQKRNPWHEADHAPGDVVGMNCLLLHPFVRLAGSKLTIYHLLSPHTTRVVSRLGRGHRVAEISDSERNAALAVARPFRTQRLLGTSSCPHRRRRVGLYNEGRPYKYIRETRWREVIKPRYEDELEQQQEIVEACALNAPSKI